MFAVKKKSAASPADYKKTDEPQPDVNEEEEEEEEEKSAGGFWSGCCGLHRFPV